MKVVMISCTLGYDDIRIKKEVLSLKNKGYTVKVIGRGDQINNSESKVIDGIEYITISDNFNTVPDKIIDIIKGSWVYKNSIILKCLIAPYLLVYKFTNSDKLKYKLTKKLYDFFIHQIYEYDVWNYVKQNDIKYDYVHAHDLYTLASAHRLSVEADIPLIYDSHEFESDYNHKVSLKFKWWIKFKERIYLRKKAHVITVSDKIGEILLKIYKPKSVSIIYNSPYYKTNRISNTIRTDLNIDEDVPLIIYIGKFAYDDQQGNKLLLEMLPHYKKAHFATVGPRDEYYDQIAFNRAKELNVSDRVHFLPKVPLIDLVQYISGSSAGVVLFQTDTLTNVLSLPNKFFEMAFANIPVIYRSGLSEIERIANEFDFGFKLVDQSGKGLADALKSIEMHPEKYKMDIGNLEEFKKRYSWETQEEKLAKIYEKISND